MKRIKLDLKELEAELSSMEMEETRILLGGTGYEDYGKDDMDPDNNDGKYMDYNPDTGAWFDTGEKGSNNGNIETGGNSNNQWDENDFPDNGYENDDRDYDRGDNEGNQSGQGNNNGGNGPEYIDGVSSLSNINFIGNTFNNFNTFENQLIGLLSSNHSLANILEPITSKMSINFVMDYNMPNDKIFLTGIGDNGELRMRINANFINESLGWTIDNPNTNGGDGIDYSTLNYKEDFAAMIAHEMIHAQHVSLFLQAINNASDQKITTIYSYMLNDMKVDASIVDIFFNKDSNGNITQNLNPEEKAHQYMSDPASGTANTIMEVVNEFREDSQKMQSRIQGLEQGMSEMEQDKNDPDGRYNEKAFNEMLSEHRNLSEQYGWMWK